MGVKPFYIFYMLSSLLPGESSGQTVYGVTGENVYLHLESHGRSFHDIQWRHENTVIVKKTHSIKPFIEIFKNGTLKLHNVWRNGSGLYTAEAYDDQGIVKLNRIFHLVVIDPPVVELAACTLKVSVLICAGESGPDAVYEWFSVQNQGHRKVHIHAGKYVALNYSTGIISCSLKLGNYSFQSEIYPLSCAGTSLLNQEMKWCVSVEVIVMLVLLCFVTCGISVGVQICRKLRNSHVKSEGSSLSVQMTQDDGIVYSEVRVGKQCR